MKFAKTVCLLSEIVFFFSLLVWFFTTTVSNGSMLHVFLEVKNVGFNWIPDLLSAHRWKGGHSVKLEGSDHAPVLMSLHEIPDVSLHSTPSLSARYVPMVHGIQQTLGTKHCFFIGWDSLFMRLLLMCICFWTFSCSVSVDEKTSFWTNEIMWDGTRRHCNG